MMKRTLKSLAVYIFLMILVIVILSPLAWIILNSLKTNREMFADSLALPVSWQFQNYVKAWNLGLYRYFGNSLIVSSISLVGILTCSSLLAYGLTRF